MGRVLVVDDNMIARALIRSILENNGHQVVAEAKDLDGALSAYQAQRPDLVTLDLSLVDTDGLTILRALLKKDRAARVLVISANSQKKMRDEVLKAGAIGLLPKPFEAQALLEAITAL